MTTTSAPHHRSKLERAIIASLLAMASFNLVVLAQQVQTAPTLAAADAIADAIGGQRA